MKRRIGKVSARGIVFVLLAVGLLAGAAWLLVGGPGPNVLVVVLDTTRGDRFSCMGYERKTSPRIDELAEEGVLYRQAYTTDFWTLPAHASLFSGLYPSQTGATSETNQFPRRNMTLAEVLGDNGYATAAFVCNSWVSKERGFGQGFDEYFEMWRSDTQAGTAKDASSRAEGAAAEKVVGWLSGHSSKDEPFFVFVNLNCVHMPYRPPEPFRSRFLGNTYDSRRVTELSKISGMWEHLAGKLELTDNDYRAMGDLYDGEIAFADMCVGQIVDALEKEGILDDTLVIITSDHGENIGEHGMIDHLLSMYDTTLHIPLVLRYPERFAAGEVRDEPVSLVDIMPTVLDVCGLENEAAHLKAPVTSLASEDRSERVFIVAENERPVNGIELMTGRYPEFDVKTINYRMRALRTARYKLIWKMGVGVELYDLENDAEELQDLAETNLAVRNSMHAMLKTWMSRIPAMEDVSLFQSTDKESIEILRSLGYIK